MNATVVVFDCGSSYIRSGFSIDDEPTSIMPSYITELNADIGVQNKRKSYIGAAAQNLRGIMKLECPIHRGIITNWDEMEQIWDYCFHNELGIYPQSHPILLTEVANNPRANRERLTQIMFEKFNVPAMYLALDAILALFSMGRLTGLSLVSGDGLTSIVPIYEGYSIKYGIETLELAGSDLTQYLSKLTNQYDHKLSNHKEILRDLKETECYVAQNFKREMQEFASRPSLQTIFPLGDGTILNLGSERIACPEALFDPSVLGTYDVGIPEYVMKSIRKCDSLLHRDLFSKIVLAGGNTLFPGFAERLKNEVVQLAPRDMSVRVLASERRINNVWTGGAILSSLSTFHQMYINNWEYYERGPHIVNIKCF